MSLAELNTFLVWGTAAGDAPAFGAFAVDLARRTEVSTARRAPINGHRPGSERIRRRAR
ncbi:MAG: hypothetical protein KQH57_11510 [Actinomycetales bacterium]|nr:hypothetical protein [Actinomycetales bacterium]